MRLETERRDHWPPLGWLATCSRRRGAVQVLHGPRVEVGDGFACEATWPGAFEAGGFDGAAVVVGSGVRVHGGEAVFVSATSTVDRLHWVERPDGPMVSNSLACLMGAIGARPALEHWAYVMEMNSIVKGLDRYQRTVRTTAEPVRLTYFRNLAWEGGELVERDKPPDPADLATYEEYRDFVRSTMLGLAANMSSGARRHPLRWLGTLSSGYDSAAATTLGVEVGCDQAICFDRSRKDEPDSGEPIARALGIEPLTIERRTWRALATRHDPMPEIPFVAGMPHGELAPFAAAREHLEGRVLLTGFQGGAAWRLRKDDPGAEIRRKDSSGTGFTEFRLVAGFLNCPPAFWTARHAARAILAIGRSAQMRPWVTGDRYQKPIARRIIEEAGVPRSAFGQYEQPGVGGALTHEEEFLGPESLADYRLWLRRNVGSLGRARLLTLVALDALARVAAPVAMLAGSTARAAERLTNRPLARLVRRRVERVEVRLAPLKDGLAARMFVFHWAIDRQAERYGPAPDQRSDGSAARRSTRFPSSSLRA